LTGSGVQCFVQAARPSSLVERETTIVRTAIGVRLNSSPCRLSTAIVITFLVVAIDLALIRWDRQPVSTQGRYVLALIALAINLWLVQGDLVSIGLVSPRQGWRYWARAGLLIGFAVAVCILVGLAAWVWSGHEVPIFAAEPRYIDVLFLQMCVFAPVMEETVYRLVICVAATASVGPWAAIAVSGFMFGVLHLAYGTPSPENLVGGFFLAWAYLKSESILVPVLLHSVGNLCALAAQVGAWYWFAGGA
jgi:uncharacterized protein